MLLDPTRSRAVLIGVDAYAELPDLPSVANNVTALAGVLRDPNRWGIPQAHCVTVSRPHRPQVVGDAVHTAATEVATDGLLLVYFAGHGVVDEDTGELYLAVGGTTVNAVYRTAVPYDWVRRSVLHSRCDNRVVVLDCCYSGRAIGGMAGSAIAERAEIDRSCVVVAASANHIAIAPPDEMYTAFTGALLNVLRGGIEGAGEAIEVGRVFDEIVRVQRAHGRPIPEMRARNGGERIPLVRNARAVAPEPTDVAQRAHTKWVGQVLTASERAPDPELAGATVAVLAQSGEGAIGVRLDRRITRSAADVLGEERAVLVGSTTVFDGGPVRDAVLVLGAVSGPAPPQCHPIADGIVSVPVDSLGSAAPALSAAFVFVGYLAWRPGQLDAEIERGELEATDERLIDGLTRGGCLY